MNELALFAGAGGGILGGHLLGWKTVCAIEIENYPRKVLLQRQRDGILPRFPIWDDITTFDGRPWQRRVDIVSGGFPCQDISAAGKGAGVEGDRSGLWTEMARVIGEVRPKFAFVENSPMLTSRGLGRVLGDLAEMGYNARWCVLGADDSGAEHIRKRIWILAYSRREHGEKRHQAGMATDKEERKSCSVHYKPSSKRPEVFTDSNCTQLKRGKLQVRERKENAFIGHTRWGKDKPGVDRMANGMAYQVDRLKAIGNGQVPTVAALAFTILSEGLI